MSSPKNKDVVERIADRIKYVGYIIVYATVGSSNEKKRKGSNASHVSTGIKRATSLSAASQGSQGTPSMKKQMLQFFRIGSSDIDEEIIRKPPPPPFRMGPKEDAVYTKNRPLDPVTINGHLRDYYVQHLVDRVNEERNRDAGWTKECLRKWFGKHLQKQVSSGQVPRNLVAHFLAAVDLHKRMSLDPRVPHPNGMPKDPDTLWVDVVEALNPGMKIAKASLMHTSGMLTCTLEEFEEEFHKVVWYADWNKKMGLPEFPDMSTTGN